MTVAPDLDLVLAAVLGFEDLAADCGGGLFTAAGPGAFGAIDVVETSNATLHAVVFFEVATHALTEEFFPSVSVFRHGRVGVFFFKGNHVWVGLFVALSLIHIYE